MGSRGPTPAPAAVKLALGETRPSRVNYLEPKPRRADPEMPEDMSDAAQAVWQRVMDEMADAGVIFAADTDVLRCYCEAVSQYRDAMRQLREGGLIVDGRHEPVKNPLHQIVRESRDAVRLFARELGLSPAARAGLNIEIGATGGGDMAGEIGLPPRLRALPASDAGS